MKSDKARRHWAAPNASPVGLLLVAGLLAGCAAGPDFVRPAAPDVAEYTSTPVPRQTASVPLPLGNVQRLSPQAEVDAQWWRSLGSSRLDALISQALGASPTLAAAEATLRQAQELYAAQAGSSLAPQVEGGLGIQRQGQSTVTNLEAPGGRVSTQYSASIGVNYRLDLAGSNRRALEALAARADYRRYELQGAQLAVAGNIAAAAIRQAALAAQIGATEDLVKAQEEQVFLTRERVRLGQAAHREVLTLYSQLEQTRSALPALQKQLQQGEHLLAVLVGRAPASDGLPRFTLADFSLPSELPYVLPSELVRRRPDIQAAEALLHAANAEYGVAVANMYPQLTISASLGSQALTAGSLFGGGSAVWGLAGQLTKPLFDAGLPAKKREALAAFDAAAANYRQVVLECLRNVADVLRSVEHDAQTLAALAYATEAAQESLQLVHNQYSLGAANYIELLVAYQQLQQARIGLITAQSQRLLDSAALYQAIGGPPA